MSISSTPTFEPQIPIAAITDEFAPSLNQALPVMKEIGMNGAELRTIDGKNIVDLSHDELARVRDEVGEAGFSVICIASPLLKCILPTGPEIDTRFQQDAFAARHTFQDQERLAQHTLEIATFLRAPIVRVFSYWRTVKPEHTFDAVIKALHGLSVLAASAGLIVGLENEHACNVATAREASRMLQAVNVPNVQLVWDPANALVAGESPFPEGFGLLAPNQIAHVHAKDCHMQGTTPIWGPLGTRHVRWKEQIAALRKAGYGGSISLETHWSGPQGNKCEGSRICGWNLRGLVSL